MADSAVQETPTGIYTVELKAKSGFLLEPLAYRDSGLRTEVLKNWLAVIADFDPESPFGLKRVFMKRGKGNYYYFIRELKVGDVIEFGADVYNTTVSKTKYYRRYAVVLDVADEYLKVATRENWIAQSPDQSSWVAEKAFKYARTLKEEKQKKID